jgi:5'-3' exonuclease
MGIPSYFSYIVKNHRNIIKKKENLKLNINNFFLDSNSIIYDCMREIKNYTSDSVFEKKLIDDVCKKIDYYILKINPTNLVYISIDGVAPFAKLKQQKNRRYMSIIEKDILIKTNIINETKYWDKSAITPGTNFMKKLNKKLHSYYSKVNNIKRLNVENIIVSGSDEIGEGEHKIFQYFRNNEICENDSNVIYGLDADLIMLCLNHLYMNKNIYLYRETPEFIKSIDSGLEPNIDYVLDIPLLSEYIITEITHDIKKLSLQQKNNKISDYIFICFLLGNDFLPHFPSLNIRTNGVNILLNTYKNTLSDNEFLTNNNSIRWDKVKKLVDVLGKNELNNIKLEYKIREKLEKRNYFNKDKIKLKQEKFLNIPTKNRSKELYIDPHNYLWNKRYYEVLFNIEINNYYKKKICLNYLEGLEWTYKYYKEGCIDWRWKYNYDYPPLFYDLFQYVPLWSIDMIDKNNNKCVSELFQLTYVLPKESNHLLPTKIKKKLELSDWYYNDSYDIEWSFCKYFWESHIKFNYFDINKLELLINE